MRSIVSLFFLLLIGNSGFAQRECGTQQYANSQFTTLRPNGASDFARDTIVNEIITIPVVIHLLYNNNEQNISDDQILSQLEVLNRDYRRMNLDAANTPAAFKNAAADTRIMFCLAQVAPDGRSTKGIIRKFTGKSFFLGDDAMKFSAQGGDDAWDSKKYLNIWVCSLFGRSLGYATMPGGPADKDGVVIKYDVFGSRGFLRQPYNKGRTATHEVAHWMGLKHLWGDANCGSDDVDDTPAQQSYNFDCPSFPQLSSCSPNGNGDMFTNFMDFTSDACMNMFTHGQKVKMRSTFSVNGPRNSFLNSFACDSTLASGGPLPVDTVVIAKARGAINAFPNPVGAELNIVALHDYPLHGKTGVIYNAVGAPVLRVVFNSSAQKIDVVSLPAGMYILKIGDGDDKRIVKIIKI